LTTLQRPDQRIIRSIEQRLLSIIEPNSQAAGNAAESVETSITQREGLESPLLLSSKGIFDDVKDLVLLPSVPAEDPTLIAWVSDTMARHKYFKVRPVQIDGSFLRELIEHHSEKVPFGT
jgi:hypothetical protein